MPAFTSLADADAWRAVHAPARKSPETSPKIPAESAEKSSVLSSTATTHNEKPRAAGQGTAPPAHARPPKRGAGRGELPDERIDVAMFVDKQADFDALMIEQAEELPQIAFGLLRRASTRGEPGAISAATKNWHEASKAAADVREKFIEIQKATRALVPIDDVEDVVATELREVGKFLKKLGARCSAAANPADPALAQRVVDAAVDELLAMFGAVVERTKLELEVAKQNVPV